MVYNSIMQGKGRKALYRTAAVLLGVLVFCGALLLSLMIADYACEGSARTLPSYAKEDISALADKEGAWTEEEIRTLFRQTGLGECALVEMKKQVVYENDALVPLSKRLQPFQDALFYEGKTEHEVVALCSRRDIMVNYYAPVAPVMQAGDVFVNSSTHTLGYRNGHSSLVLDEFGTVLESLEFGAESAVSTSGDVWFAQSSNFILLRLRDVDKDARAKIANDAVAQLKNIPYSLTVGVLSKKDQGTNPKSTQCSHLVWQAYKNAGYDIDYNGGMVVSPHDIARSPLFEIVQVYGFDPDKLW